MKEKRKLNAYMTLEASLLMPLVWFGLFFAIFTGFFLYDRCIAEQDCKIILLQASNMEEKDGTEIIRRIRERANLADQKKLLFGHSALKDFHVTDKKVEVTIKGNVPTILNHLMKNTELSSFAYEAKYETDRYEPVRFIRTCRRLEHYVEG